MPTVEACSAKPASEIIPTIMSIAITNSGNRKTKLRRRKLMASWIADAPAL